MFTNNKIKNLKTDSNADLIFKKGDYLHTYIVIKTTGIPNGEILYLLDGNLNQLYSPYDINGNEIKSPCFIISGETDALQLPADYITENNYEDFEAGIYNWKLKYDGDETTFLNKIIPITVKICDFTLEENLTSEIYPDQDIQIQLKTYINTFPKENDFDNDRLTSNATYDDVTGIITYPNSDIINLNTGEHTQIINQQKEYIINYKIKNPIECSMNQNIFDYNDSIEIESVIANNCSLIFNSNTLSTATINNTEYFSNNRSSNNKTDTFILNNIPPGSYVVEISSLLNNSNNYTNTNFFEVTTNNCEINLSAQGEGLLSEANPIVQLKSSYTYNSLTPIINAKMALINIDENYIVEEKITDNNGEILWEVDEIGYYQVVALDYYNDNILLSSNQYYVREDLSENYIEDININNNGNLLLTITRTETPANKILVNDIDIDNGNLIVNIETGTSNSVKNIYIKNGNLKCE